MDPAFWLQRWREGQIGFHLPAANPLLLAHWPALALPAGARVLVPLAGKSHDLAWLAEQGLAVTGVELSPLAVTQFFAEHAGVPETWRDGEGLHHCAGTLDLIEGDVFDLRDDTLATVAAIYDRAALVALPPPLRERYVGEVYGRLPLGTRGLLLTMEYPQAERDGPPFSVTEDEVRAHLARYWHVELLERHDILAEEPRFAAQGVTTLTTAVYRLHRIR
jgi:thiopurine S-methyltransferase